MRATEERPCVGEAVQQMMIQCTRHIPGDGVVRTGQVKPPALPEHPAEATSPSHAWVGGRPMRLAAVATMKRITKCGAAYIRRPRSVEQPCGTASKLGGTPATPALPQRLKNPARGKKRTRACMATIETTEPPGPLVDAGTPVQAGPTAAAPASQAPEKQWSGVAPLETSGGQAMLAAQHAVAAAAAAATAVPQQAASADVQDEMVEAAVAEVQEQANAAAVEAKAPDTEAVQVAAPSAEVASQIEAQAAPAPQMLGSQAAGSQDPSSVQARVPAAALARAVSLPWCRLQLPLGCSLVVDTETTGFPRRLPGTPVTGHLSGDVPYTDLEGWSTARVVSIAWRVLAPWSEGLVLREHGYHIVQPDGFVIPDDAARIHGITTQHAQQAGAPLDRVMDELMDAVQRWNCGIIVAHNLKYDRTVILSELHRRNRAQDVAHLERMAGVCTANCSKAYLQRFYRQAELLMQLMGETMPRAHDAVNDAEACSKCYVALLKSFGG